MMQIKDENISRAQGSADGPLDRIGEWIETAHDWLDEQKTADIARNAITNLADNPINLVKGSKDEDLADLILKNIDGSVDHKAHPGAVSRLEETLRTDEKVQHHLERRGYDYKRVADHLRMEIRSPIGPSLA